MSELNSIEFDFMAIDEVPEAWMYLTPICKGPYTGPEAPFVYSSEEYRADLASRASRKEKGNDN